MGVEFNYEPAENVLHIKVHHSIRSREDVDYVIGRIKRMAREVGKPYFLTDLSNLEVDSRIADYLGEQVKRLAQDYSLGIYRYSTSPYVRVLFRSQGVRKGFRSNIYPTKEEALRALRSERGHQG
jgi:hypothetical protein